jgi:catalase
MQRIENRHREEAIDMLGDDPDFSTRDLFEAIERGEFPKWRVCVQIMDDGQASAFPYNPFDLTKVWPQKQFPLHEVGVMTLNRNPQNYFAEVEQAAFAPPILFREWATHRTRCSRPAFCPIRMPIANACA